MTVALRSPAKLDIRLVSVDLLFVDTTYQRAHSKLALSKMTGENFCEAAVNVIDVAERQDGRFAIIDGQHRWLLAMLERFGWVWVNVIPCKNIGEEAKIFSLMNNRKRLKGTDTFRALLASDDDAAHFVQDTLKECGFNLVLVGRPAKGCHNIKSAKTLLTAVHETSMHAFSTTMRVISQAWCHKSGTSDAAALTSDFILALCRAIHAANMSGKDNEIIMRLAGRTAFQIVGDCSKQRGHGITTELTLVLQAIISPASTKTKRAYPTLRRA